MTDQLFYTVIIVSLLIAIIIVFFVISVIRYHKRYMQLQKEKVEVQIEIQEQERKRIANDLHDSFGPMLSTVKLYLHSIGVDNETDEQALAKASDYIDETIGNLREISYNLLPGSLHRNNLPVVVKEYLSRIASHNALKIQFNATKEDVLQKKVEIHLFRIIQEIVQNTIKHAAAQNLKISLNRNVGELLLISEDDGKGFNAADVKGWSTGLGLKSIENRCEMINASFKIISANGAGCKIIIKLPG